ncbi:hypothetical protein BDQ17DRAFT_1542680 [Cyathus striatus]|nr:hypothetical protein BDQ17DRAFT_1542680 [Cyathus striatus]
MSWEGRLELASVMQEKVARSLFLRTMHPTPTVVQGLRSSNMDADKDCTHPFPFSLISPCIAHTGDPTEHHEHQRSPRTLSPLPILHGKKYCDGWVDEIRGLVYLTSKSGSGGSINSSKEEENARLSPAAISYAGISTIGTTTPAMYSYFTRTKGFTRGRHIPPPFIFDISLTDHYSSQEHNLNTPYQEHKRAICSPPATPPTIMDTNIFTKIPPELLPHTLEDTTLLDPDSPLLLSLLCRYFHRVIITSLRVWRQLHITVSEATDARPSAKRSYGLAGAGNAISHSGKVPTWEGRLELPRVIRSEAERLSSLTLRFPTETQVRYFLTSIYPSALHGHPGAHMDVDSTYSLLSGVDVALPAPVNQLNVLNIDVLSPLPPRPLSHQNPR